LKQKLSTPRIFDYETSFIELGQLTIKNLTGGKIIQVSAQSEISFLYLDIQDRNIDPKFRNGVFYGDTMVDMKDSKMQMWWSSFKNIETYPEGCTGIVKAVSGGRG
jgi:hypothetical protein